MCNDGRVPVCSNIDTPLKTDNRWIKSFKPSQFILFTLNDCLLFVDFDNIDHT